ncbi:MAG TPA: class I SAM-dependent methyltransferase [Stellaceae bacterium]|nr:class I SAM-dependent methyltransferase [Stellaceae bacterium]
MHRYLAHVPRVIASIASDPTEACFTLRTKLVEIVERQRPRFPYVPDPDWERRLHEWLGLTYPVGPASEFRALWPTIIAELRSRGLQLGPASFGIWNDGDPEFLRAIWCLARHLRPMNVVETGVARGLTSRVILEALERNGQGHLWSIDRPPALAPELRDEIGIAVGSNLRPRWTYIRGSSRRRLPALLKRLGRIDLFIHDSMHTTDNVCFELSHAWSALQSGGALVADDIDLNWGFHDFTQTLCDGHSLICQSKPLTPDPRRFDGKGSFGIAERHGPGMNPRCPAWT